MGQLGYFLFQHYVNAQRGMGQIGYFPIYFQPETEEYLEMYLQNIWGS